MGWLITALGAALVLLVLRDIFHTLFHPTGQGTLSRLVMRAVWRLCHFRIPKRLQALAGPLALVAAIGTWTLLVAIGWTLIYWAHMPEGFAFAQDLEPAIRPDLLDSLYLSIVTLATLGYGDITPKNGWLLVASPLQALVGFTLISAAVSWVLQIYPALARRRTLAVRLSLMQRSASERWLADDQSSIAAPTLEAIAAALVEIRVDLTQYAESYFFRDGDPDASLPVMLGYVVELCELGHASQRADVRIAADLLQAAVDDLAARVDEQFLQLDKPTMDVLVAYAEDHGHSLAQR